MGPCILLAAMDPNRQGTLQTTQIFNSYLLKSKRMQLLTMAAPVQHMVVNRNPKS